MPVSLTKHLIVPVANEDDARTTAWILDSYEFERVSVIHVIEKREGGPNAISPEQAEQQAKDAFTAFREVIPSAEAELTSGSNVVTAIIDVAADVEASAIAFRPRGGSRIVQFLSGDMALKLITEADRPVIALPEESDR